MLGIRGVLVIACITHFNAINALTSVEHKNLEFHDKELIFGYGSSKNGKFVYATCTKNKETKERDCQAVLETTPYSGNMKTCNIKIKLKRRNKDVTMDTDKIKILPLAENKAILYAVDVTDMGYTHIKTINFDDCTHIGYDMSFANPVDQEDRTNVVVYKDGFDYFVYHKKALAGRNHLLVKFGPEGMKEDRPPLAQKDEKYPPTVVLMAPISESEDKDMYYIRYVNGSGENSQFELALRKPDGSDVSLGNHEIHSPMVVVTNDDLIGTCFLTRSSNLKSTCRQYDTNGQEKFNISPVKDEKNSAAIAVHNLPGGGMLVVVGSGDAGYDRFHEINFSVIKIDAAGATVGTAKLGKVKAVSKNDSVGKDISFHKNKDNNDCISIANYERTSTDRMDSGLLGGTDYCLTDADFTK